jgi:recombinational DNA repair protein (RecF pathway)
VTRRRCEECGRTFEPDGGSTSTLDGRVICGKCVDRAERARSSESRDLEQSGLADWGAEAFKQASSLDDDERDD